MLLAGIGRLTCYYHIMLEDFMRGLSHTEHEIMYLLSEGNCPKKNIRKITYIVWYCTMAPFKSKKII